MMSTGQLPPDEISTRTTSKGPNKISSAKDAIRFIESGSTIACNGFVGAGHPEALTKALEQRFLETGQPRDLTLVYAAGQGDGQSRGLNRLAHEGLLRRVIGGHWGLAPKLGDLALRGAIEAYNLPQGVLCQLYRDIAAGRPGCLTHIGLGTFIDPEELGGKLNQRTQEEIVSSIAIHGVRKLFYRAFPIHVALIRASAVDPRGGLVMDQEAVHGDILTIAQAAKNSGGIVIAQVQRILEHNVEPQRVAVPGILVDHIVLAPPEDHWQTYGESFNPSYCQAMQPSEACSLGSLGGTGAIEAGDPARWIIARRACDELQPEDVANLGIGMPEGIAKVAEQRKILDRCTLTVESGPIGGVPASGLSFGASAFPQAIIDQAAQFDFYDGGGLDYAALGAAQIDRLGNVNVSLLGNRFVGVGGFVNIAQNAKRLVFCGTLTTGGLETEVREGRLRIIREGRTKKFVDCVDQVCFSSIPSYRRATEVLYITERAVFRWTPEGLELIEVAPGIDLEKQVLAQMEFAPIMRQVRQMPEACFVSKIH